MKLSQAISWVELNCGPEAVSRPRSREVAATLLSEILALHADLDAANKAIDRVTFARDKAYDDLKAIYAALNMPECDLTLTAAECVQKLKQQLAEARRVTFDPIVLEKMNKMEQQRDELLAALEEIVAPPPEIELAGISRLRRIASAAIAKVKS